MEFGHLESHHIKKVFVVIFWTVFRKILKKDKINYHLRKHLIFIWEKNLWIYILRPTLKSCLFPIHWAGEIKIVMNRLRVKTFFCSLFDIWYKIYDIRYMIKRFKNINSSYNKNVTLYIFIFNFYVQFLCWFIVIW